VWAQSHVFFFFHGHILAVCSWWVVNVRMSRRRVRRSIPTQCHEAGRRHSQQKTLGIKILNKQALALFFCTFIKPRFSAIVQFLSEKEQIPPLVHDDMPCVVHASHRGAGLTARRRCPGATQAPCYPWILALPTCCVPPMLTDAAPPTLLAPAALPPMLADATPSTVLAMAALALVLTDLAPSTVLALAALAFVYMRRIRLCSQIWIPPHSLSLQVLRSRLPLPPQPVRA
jgi:hypothetical protein